MDDLDSEWQRKGATLSDKTARKELGLTQDEIVEAIRAGKLQCQICSMHGNPWLRLLRREVEALVKDKRGAKHLKDQQASAELARTEQELKRLSKQVAALEKQKSTLTANLEGRPRGPAPTGVPEKLLRIVDEIREQGWANQTRLTALKKWLETGHRLPAFAIFIATRAANRKRKATGQAADLLRRARELLGDQPQLRLASPRRTAQRLFDDLRSFQDEHKKVGLGVARVIKNRDLYLVEQGLDIYLQRSALPADGYRLAASFCEHYDPHHGTGLSGPSRARIREIVQFINLVEEQER